MSPRVTVVLCSYNQGAYVADAVQSVLAQTYERWELLVIDNGSTDGTHEILRRFQDPRIRLFLSEENKAVSGRFNEGIAHARGEFVSFLYSDDWYRPEKLARQVARFDSLSPDYGVVYGPALVHVQRTGDEWQGAGASVSGHVLRELLLGVRHAPLDMISPMTRTECFRRYPFYEDIFAEGEASFFKVAMTYRFSFLDEALAVQRNHEGNRGRAIRRNADMTFECLDRLERHMDFPADCAAALAQMRTELWQSYGWQAARLDMDGRWALSCFGHAVAGSWRAALSPKTIVGCTLAALPLPVRRGINALGHRLRGGRSEYTPVEDYGGSVKEYDRRG